MPPKHIVICMPECERAIATDADRLQHHPRAELIRFDFLFVLIQPGAVLNWKVCSYREVLDPLIPFGLVSPKLVCHLYSILEIPRKRKFDGNTHPGGFTG